ncbi:flagellin [Psychrobacillus glaciei]|uniref:Flagellin n=1 Tax=Psychrobacillus glaciei TaxID=2283160 RepID=A0A5J6SKF0_9BACI|nr:flagellin [Psychrobacillus glaciei]QFF98189.1 flagellin [Psychrobacillus glaciei]
MIINHNIAALNTHRQLSTATNAQSKSMEKLASGLRINKAGDDAAGLAISEKMRGQIRGLDQASKNSQDAISLIQTGEGALNETHDILQRMRELSVQSANDTTTNDDRKKIQAEVDELAKEITRVSNTTEFNTQNLLAGGLENTYQIGANKGQNISLSIKAMDAKSLGVAGSEVSTTVTSAELAKTGISSVDTTSAGGVNGKHVAIKYDDAAVAVTAGGLTSMVDDASAYTGSSDKTFTLKAAAVDGAGKVTDLQFSTDGGKNWKSATVGTNNGADWILEDGVAVKDMAVTGIAKGATGTISATAEKLTISLDNDGAGAGRIGKEVVVHNNQSSAVIGSDATDQVVTVNFDFDTVKGNLTSGAGYSAGKSTAIAQTVTESTSATIGANGTVTNEATAKGGINVSSQSKANLAIETINNAITTVSEERSKLGAVQNRLEHTINNLNTSSENLTAAESRIRDVDMAKEMMNQTKNSILSQAAQAMLAQANQQPQGVLQLLR